MVELLLLTFLVLLLLGTLPIWPYSRAWGSYPLRGIGLVLLIVLLLTLLRQVF